MGSVGNALLDSSNAFGLESSTGVFLGFVFLTIFCGFVPLVVAYAINGKKQRGSVLKSNL